MKDKIQATFYQNIQRVRDLSQLHIALSSFPGTSNPLFYADVLRASIVLLHASLEELIRGIFKWKVPERGTEQLNKIPLIGYSTRNQPKAFLFGNLKDYKDMKIEELLKKSIDEYLNYTNYNRIEDLVEFLSDIGLEKNDFQDLFPAIREAFERRHIIVHRADRQKVEGNAEAELMPISYAQVLVYLDSVVQFGERIFSKI